MTRSPLTTLVALAVAVVSASTVTLADPSPVVPLTVASDDGQPPPIQPPPIDNPPINKPPVDTPPIQPPPVDRPPINGADQPTTTPDTSTPESPDELLVHLARADRDIRNYHANLVYEKYDALRDTSERRFGRLVFDVDPDSGRRLAFVFDQYVDGSGRTERIDQRYVFAGSWMCDVDAQRRQFIKRQVVPPGERFDPLKVGEGPFPLPIGQSPDAVRAAFEVAWAPAPTSPLLSKLDPASLHMLALTPRPGTDAARDYERIHVYYDRDSLMPVGMEAIGIEGDRKIARLSKAAINAGLSEEDVRMLSVETPDPTLWTIDVRAWES